MQKFPLNELKYWFLEQKRDFPWREDPSPYEVWISEVMLQQTQASVVAPYFHQWMRNFPSIQALAEASLEKVVKCWEGLGYYSRARNIHEGAKYIVQHFQGELPRTEEDLKRIKGLGPYTIGAILSFAFHQKKAAVDANVARVLARYFLIPEDIAAPKIQQKLRLLNEALLPDEEPHIIMEGLIELGALVCKKFPLCHACPLQGGCLARIQNMTGSIPKKKKKDKTILLFRHVTILRFENRLLLRKGERGEVMADLYEFPYFESHRQRVSNRMLKRKIHEMFSTDAVFSEGLLEISHTFTKYKARLFPTLWEALCMKRREGYSWVTLEEIRDLPFSSGHRKILQQLLAHFFSYAYTSERHREGALVTHLKE